MVARRAHNPEVAGSSPASATKNTGRPLVGRPVFLSVKFIGLEPSFAARAVKLLAFAHPIKSPLHCAGANAVQLVLPPQPR